MTTVGGRVRKLLYFWGYAFLLAVTVTLAAATGGGALFAAAAAEVGEPGAQSPRPPVSRQRGRLANAATAPATAAAIRHDGPFLTLKARFKDAWAAQDGELDRKLEALRQRFGQPPNIIYILADDVGWGELGCYLGGKLRGAPTPALDRMAGEGMKFLSAYAEPTCTPSRIALLTGRHPVRTGLTAVLWPGATEGLSPEETTIAEVLSDAGYSTAMWGKWHVGEQEVFAPERQGFDRAYYGLYNGAPFAWADVEAHYDRPTVAGPAHFFDFPGEEKYLETYGIRLDGFYRGRKGAPREKAGPINSEAMDKFEAECAEEIVAYITDQATAKRPFFIYWATYANQIAGSPKAHRFDSHVDYVNNQAAQMAAHDAAVERVLEALKEAEIAENTLVVWISDNGPMYAFYPNSGYSWLRGGKGEVTEGGVRVPAIAWWPEMIEAGQDPIDLMQITDLFTTAARLAGATDRLPDDRIIDGIDATPLLLMGEGNSRRKYIFHYQGERLAALRFNDIKFYFTGAGESGMEAYNIMRDPCEKFGEIYPYLWMVEPMGRMVDSHNRRIRQFPHRKPPASAASP